jgi:site-specific DNA-cytosine methylase
VDSPKECTHISLCAGYGGIDIGLARAIGFIRTVCFVEIEAFPISNLVSKIENNLLDEAPIWSNLKTFPWAEFRGKVDILSGGFPCQPFSGAGERKADEDPRHLWPHIVRGIKELGKPPIVFFENVEGILSSKLKSDDWSDPKDTDVLHHVLRELERLGYRATAGIFSASEIGAPHQRKRVFILGVHSKLNEFGRSYISGLLSQQWGYVENANGGGREWVDLLRCSKSESSCRQGQTGLSHVSSSTRARQAWPNLRGCEQFGWEPPRTIKGHMGNANSKGLEGSGGTILQGKKSRLACTDRGQEETGGCGQAESSMGRDFDGLADWVDYAELLTTVDNRSDELRMLGNGVVPHTAERAFCSLWAKLGYSESESARG